jgi:hypothetical protein
VRGRASWPRNPATCVSAHSPVRGGCGEGEIDRAGSQRRERKGDARGNGSAPGRTGPRGRERRGAGVKKLAPTSRPH